MWCMLLLSDHVASCRHPGAAESSYYSFMPFNIFLLCSKTIMAWSSTRGRREEAGKFITVTKISLSLFLYWVKTVLRTSLWSYPIPSNMVCRWGPGVPYWWLEPLCERKWGQISQLGSSSHLVLAQRRRWRGRKKEGFSSLHCFVCFLGGDNFKYQLFFYFSKANEQF